MPRRKNLTPSVDLHVMVPASLHKQMEEYLYSEVEARIPFQAKQKFLCEMLMGFFSSSTLDVSHYAPASLMIPPGTVVRGSAQAIECLKALLQGAQ